jgi:hypothetical protein
MDEFDQCLMNGPWRNDACMGYTILAMRLAGFDDKDIRRVIYAMHECFDDTSVKKAAEAYDGRSEGCGPVDV